MKRILSLLTLIVTLIALFVFAWLAFIQEAHEVVTVALVIIPAVLFLGFLNVWLPQILTTENKDVMMETHVLQDLLVLKLNTWTSEQAPETHAPSTDETQADAQQ